MHEPEIGIPQHGHALWQLARRQTASQQFQSPGFLGIPGNPCPEKIKFGVIWPRRLRDKRRRSSSSIESRAYTGMYVFVKTPTGKTLTLSVEPTFTAADVASAIQVAEGIPSSEQRLTFAGKMIDQGRTLADYGVESESTLFLSLCLLGGGKKRKKKVFTKPKKTKHVRKKIKLAILRYYKVGADGNVSSLRMECTQPTCGAAVFCAKHFDRYTCGKCGTRFNVKGEQKA